MLSPDETLIAAKNVLENSGMSSGALNLTASSIQGFFSSYDTLGPVHEAVTKWGHAGKHKLVDMLTGATICAAIMHENSEPLLPELKNKGTVCVFDPVKAIEAFKSIIMGDPSASNFDRMVNVALKDVPEAELFLDAIKQSVDTSHSEAAFMFSGAVAMFCAILQSATYFKKDLT